MSRRMIASLCAVAGLLTAGCLDEGTTGPACQQVSSLVTGTSGDTVTVVSGLRYIELEVGSGATAQSCQLAAVNYVGKLTNDSIFDQHDNYGVVPGSGRLIPGFEQGVVGMKVGGTRRLIIPPTLGYGSQPAVDNQGNVVIPGNSTIIFDLELIALDDSIQ